MLKRISYFLILVLSILGGIQGLNLVEQIFREANLKVNIRKEAIYDKAEILAKKLGIPSDFKNIAILSEDPIISLYSIYKLDGVDTINYLVDNKIYFPYFWKIRYYKEYNKKEFYIFLNPIGDFIGFKEKLNEEENFNNFSEEEALENAKSQALNLFALNLSNYKLIDKGFKKHINGRIDYSFFFEKEITALKETKLRFNLEFSGDKLRAINSYSYTPESFTKEYNKIRVLNNTIAYVANFLLLFYIGIILWVLVKGLKEKRLATKASLKISLFLSFLSALSYITYLPSLIYERNVNNDLFLIILNNISHVGRSVLGSLVLYFILFNAVDYIDRVAFPNHINLFAILKPKFIASKRFLYLLFIGYVMVGFDLLYEGGFYFLADKYLGWKAFSSGNISTDVFSKCLAFISPFKDSFFAGVIEEAIFRVVPIALAMTIFKKWNSKFKLALFFIIQIFIFGAAHANYPTSPSYFRVVELIIPSLVFGYLYYKFGVIPAMVSHWLFDFILMSLPIFKSINFFGLYQVIIIVVLALAPIILHFIYRIKYKTNEEEEKKYENSIVFYQKIWFFTSKKEEELVRKRSRKLWLILPTLILTFISYKNSYNITKRIEKVNIKKEEAIEKAKLVIKDYYNLEDNMYIEAIIRKNKFSSTYYQNLFKDNYSKLIDYTYPLKWVVMFRDIDLNSHYEVSLDNNGEFIGIKSKIPESIEIKSLNREDALKEVISKIKEIYKENNLELMDTKSFTLPKRTDWSFTFKVDDIRRIKVILAGDKIAKLKKNIYISENKVIDINNYLLKKEVVKNILSLIIGICLVIGIIILFTRSKLNYKGIISIPLYMLALYIFNFYSKFNLEIFNFRLNSIKNELIMKSLLIYTGSYFKNTLFILFLYLFVNNFVKNRRIKIKTIVSTIFGALIFISSMKIISSFFERYVYYKEEFHKSVAFPTLYWLVNNFYMTFIISTLILVFISILLKIMKNHLFLLIYPVLTTLFLIDNVPNSLEFSLIAGPILGGILMFLYILIFRFNFNSIPYFVLFTLLGLKNFL